MLVIHKQSCYTDKMTANNLYHKEEKHVFFYQKAGPA